MRSIVLLALGFLLFSCKTKYALFSPTSPEKYMRSEKPLQNEKLGEFVPLEDIAEHLVSADSELVFLLSVDTTAFITEDKPAEKVKKSKILLKYIQNDSIPAKQVQNDSIPQKRITELVGVFSGMTGVISLGTLTNPFSGFFIVLGVITLLLGVISLIRIKRNPKKLKGRLGAILGIIASIPALNAGIFTTAYTSIVGFFILLALIISAGIILLNLVMSGLDKGGETRKKGQKSKNTD